MRTKGKFRIWLFVVFLLCFVYGTCMTTAAADVVSVNMTGTYGQTEARRMLGMINKFRTGDDAWYWNQDNTTKTVYSSANGNGLSELKYDYDLEKTAMQRAMEIAIHFDHTRPNGQICFTAFTGSFYAFGENIAAGYRSTEAAFAGWQETDEDYSGQGHRRNMLDPGYQAVGIGHVYYNGYHYWVQEFGSPAKNTTSTEANDSDTTVPVEILPSMVTGVSAVPEKTMLTVPYGQSIDLPAITVKIKTSQSWPSGGPVSVPYEWTSADMGYVNLSSGKITGLNCGTTEISTTVFGIRVPVTVTVEPVSISSAEVILAEESCTYNGQPQKPQIQGVILEGRTLTEGKDYTVSYSNNVNAGTGSVIITGQGNYAGSAAGDFTIIPLDLSAGKVGMIEDQTYSGNAITPAVQVTYGDQLLSAGTDYKISYTNNTNSGTASVTVTGIQNYTGTLSGSFVIHPLSLEECSVNEISSQTYTGFAITPPVIIRKGAQTLINGVDYVAVYSGNVNPGTASVLISGKGNYTGQIENHFTINEKESEATTVPVSPSVPEKPSLTEKPSVSATPETSGQETSKLVPGTSVEDSRTKACYKVIAGEASSIPSVEYVKSLNTAAISVVIPDTVVLNQVTCKVTSVAAKAFQNNKKLRSVTIGKYVVTIGKKAFYGCTRLSALKLGARVETISTSAFAKCTSLTKIIIPAKVTKIEKQAFYGCKKLKKITIKTKHLTSGTVGSKAFKGIYTKATVKVPSSKLKSYKKLLKAKGISGKANIIK